MPPLFNEKLSAEGFLADSVVAAEGKLFVQGGAWNAIQTATLPARHPRIGIAIVLRVPYALADNMPHRFRLTLEDGDGNVIPLGDAPPGMPTKDGKIRSIEGGFTLGRPPGVQPGEEQALPIAANLDGLVFEKAGPYVFRLEVDETEVKSLYFRVNHFQAPGQSVLFQ